MVAAVSVGTRNSSEESWIVSTESFKVNSLDIHIVMSLMFSMILQLAQFQLIMHGMNLYYFLKD